MPGTYTWISETVLLLTKNLIQLPMRLGLNAKRLKLFYEGSDLLRELVLDHIINFCVKQSQLCAEDYHWWLELSLKVWLGVQKEGFSKRAAA